MESFRYLVENSRNPICYNGNLCSISQIQKFSEEYPQVDAVMIGRGLIGDPGMLLPGGTDIDTLERFLEVLLETYTDEFGGPRNAMFRMKENWCFLIHKFEGSDKLWKKLRKTTDISKYRSITHQILHSLPLKPELGNEW